LRLERRLAGVRTGSCLAVTAQLRQRHVELPLHRSELAGDARAVVLLFR
jgi:hypothetical protein